MSVLFLPLSFPFSLQYLIVKDPNKPIMRVYSIPQNTFESDDDEEESEEEEEEEGEEE